jgi:hypothetical protein
MSGGGERRNWEVGASSMFVVLKAVHAGHMSALSEWLRGGHFIPELFPLDRAPQDSFLVLRIV